MATNTDFGIWKCETLLLVSPGNECKQHGGQLK